MSATAVEYDDIQGLVRFGYKRLTQACFLLLRVTDAQAARDWLARAPVSSAKTQEPPPTTALQVALTSAGLQALGVQPDVVEGFSHEFIVGMASDASRARRLGDLGANDPAGWQWGGSPEQLPHVLLMLYAAPGGLEDWQREVLSQCEQGFEQLGFLDTSDMDGVEPFGFADGISEPSIDWLRERPARDEEAGRYSNLSCLGEYLLGYPNEYGAYTDRPLLDANRDPEALLPRAEDAPDKVDLGRNGSYLVFRKLQQHVGKFREYVREHGDGNPELLGAKMVGRWADGTSLVLAPGPNPPARTSGEPENGFGYAMTDPFGYGCPLGAHVRRTNPRDAMSDRDPVVSEHDVRRHRILRRGAPYGPRLEPGGIDDDDPPRGLLFLCINADFKRQFEFIQQTWVNNPKFHGMNNDRDPVIGDNVDPDDKDSDLKPRVFTIQKDGVRRRLKRIPRFVTTKGGAYFFLPGISAIHFLARTAGPSHTSENDAERGPRASAGVTV